MNLATVAVEHDFGAGLTLRNRTSFGDYQKFYQNIFAERFNAGDRPGALGAYNNRNDRQNLFSQTDLVWENRLAGIDQTLLVGFEVGREKSRNERMTGTFVGGNSVPISDPTVDADVIWAPLPSDADNRVKATVAAAYIQDQIRPPDWLEMSGGCVSTASRST